MNNRLKRHCGASFYVLQWYLLLRWNYNMPVMGDLQQSNPQSNFYCFSRTCLIRKHECFHQSCLSWEHGSVDGFETLLHNTHALQFVLLFLLFLCFQTMYYACDQFNVESCAEVDWWWFTKLVSCSRRAQREKGWARSRIISNSFTLLYSDDQ